MPCEHETFFLKHKTSTKQVASPLFQIVWNQEGGSWYTANLRQQQAIL